MAPLKNPRVAWSVAIAALALWATSVPSTWGQVAGGAARWVDDSTTQQISEVTPTPADETDPANLPCPPPTTIVIPPPLTAVTPPAPLTPPPPPQPAAGDGQAGTFRLCGGDMSAAARAIEQLIAGRGFSANLSAHGDGCADLMVRATSQSTGGSATSRLSVSLGSGQNLVIQIVSANGATHVDIGPGN